MSDLDELFEQARAAGPVDRVDFRDPIAAHGSAAIPTLGRWLADPRLARFAVRTLERIAAAPACRVDVLDALAGQDPDLISPDMEQEIEAAADRISELPMHHAGGRTGSALEARFHEDMLQIYQRAGEATRHERADGTFVRGYWATYFRRGVLNHGGLLYAKQLLRKSGTTYGFQRLAEAHRLDLTMEALVLQEEYADLFTEEERKIAAGNLARAGYQPPRR